MLAGKIKNEIIGLGGADNINKRSKKKIYIQYILESISFLQEFQLIFFFFLLVCGFI